jgi:hypothetical protein
MTCSTDNKKNYASNFDPKISKEESTRRIDTDWRLILKWVFEKRGKRLQRGFICHRIEKAL